LGLGGITIKKQNIYAIRNASCLRVDELSVKQVQRYPEQPLFSGSREKGALSTAHWIVAALTFEWKAQSAAPQSSQAESRR